MHLFKILVLFIFYCTKIHASHIQGSWNTNKDFFSFLIKFGFDKTDSRQPDSNLGYIYGNITSSTNSKQNATFVLLDRTYFLEYYGNRTLYNKETACHLMFNHINESAYDPWCNNDKKMNDFLRRVPCKKGQICSEESNQPLTVVKGSQFTFRVQDNSQPRFWYASLVACYLNTTSCKWQHLTEEIDLEYDIWFVNGNPNHSSHNPLVYQFSFDKQNTAQMYLLFFMIYCLLLPVQLYAVAHQRHPVTKLFTASLILEVVGIAFNLINMLKYAYDGEGYPKLSCTGDVLDILSRTTFMLLLILLAKGWAVTRIELSWKPFSILLIWFIYGVVHILLYVWNMTEVDIIEDIDEYQTWPGWLILILRTFISGWFLTELRTTMLYEHNAQKLNFFLHFGASALVWFIYLPIVALVALQVSALWRFKLLLGITYSADCIAFCMMTHLLWPTRSEQYFLLADNINLGDELDEFNEAPHILNTYKSPVYQPTILATDDYKYIQLSNGNNIINS